MTPTELAPRFFIAVAVILIFCKAVAWLLGRAGQPPVVSEMLAGVLLGPSLLGLLFPGVQHALFPAQLLPILYVVGQVGLVLFMFQAGYAFTGHRSTRLAGPAEQPGDGLAEDKDHRYGDEEPRCELGGRHGRTSSK